jgi:CDP-glucose 4,6-dehydratase
MYKIAKRNEIFKEESFHDISKLEQTRAFIQKIQPDFIFHLAAQSIVSTSYEKPHTTFRTNILGFSSVLESLINYNKKCIAIFVSSDKCYQNNEWVWGYRENDTLSGKDPYSASKSAAEIVFKSYFDSFLFKEKKIKIVSVRAGNVIGGGDWSKDRIVPDYYRSINSKKNLTLRNPNAIRPWQHVLEPIYAYLLIGAKLALNQIASGESFNIGPNNDSCISVEELINKINAEKEIKVKIIVQTKNFEEANILKLNTDKAQTMIGWNPILNLEQTIELVDEWYMAEPSLHTNNHFTQKQINYFKKLIF